MKKTILLILIACSFNFVNAQDKKKDEVETIFSKPEKIRGYFSHINSISYINGETAYLSGMNAAGIFNDQFILGFYRLSLRDYVHSQDNNSVLTSLDFDHEGLWLGYIFMPKKVMHFNTNVQLGMGNLEVFDPTTDNWIEDDMIFVITPSIEAEFNIFKFFRLGIGANYRFTSEIDKATNFSNSDLSNFGGFISFKFGWFN